MSQDKEPIDPTKLRYVLYARKSSEENGNQFRSIGDQISDCKQYAAKNHLKIKAIVEEKKSAKVPNRRPFFRQMLEDIRAGKYDGILFWHPDRLARNMLEAGEIIDLIDNGIIKDLQSPTFHFDNDSSGKMMLGMLFVFAKQYSEHLSESVLRGNANNLKEGKSAGTPKWGYTRSSDGRYKPDENFDFIKEGWEMRANGANLNDVLNFWIGNNVYRLTKENPRKHTVVREVPLNKKATASSIFRDPFYYGILCQSGKEIDLTELYDFKPMIDKETYVKVQAISRARTSATKANQGKTFFPFRQMVICGGCGKRMSVGASTNPKGNKYLYYRCDNKECNRKPRGIRGNIILRALYKEVDRLEFTDKEYELFNKRVKEFSDEMIDKMTQEKHSLTASLSKKQSEFDTLSVGRTMQLAKGARINDMVEKALNRKMEMLENEIVDLTAKIQIIDDKLSNPIKLNETKEEFLNIVKTLGFKMRNGNPAEKDNLARIMLLNIQINNKNEPIFIWKEPFNSLIKAKTVQIGAPD